MSLVVPVDLAVERHPAGLHQGAHLTLGDVGVPFQDMGYRSRDVRVVPWLPEQLDLEVIGNCLDTVNSRGSPGRRQLLAVGRHAPRQRHRPVLDGYADRLRIGYLRIPPQLSKDVFPDLAVGFHRLPPGSRVLAEQHDVRTGAAQAASHGRVGVGGSPPPPAFARGGRCHAFPSARSSHARSEGSGGVPA